MFFSIFRLHLNSACAMFQVESGQATANKRSLVHVEGEGEGSTARCGMRHNASSCTSYTHVYLATCGCRCSTVGPRRAPDSPANNGNDYEKRIHAGERRASVGHLAQSSGPQTVWERDLQPAAKVVRPWPDQPDRRRRL